MNAQLNGSSRTEIVPYDSAHMADAIEIALEIHRSSALGSLPLNTQKLVYHLDLAGKGMHPDRYLRMAVRDGEVLGAFYGCIQPVYFSDGVIAKDLGWFVRPIARGGKTAALLLEDFEAWARSRGAAKILLGQITAEKVDQTAKLYQHCGYRIVGYNVSKDL